MGHAKKHFGQNFLHCRATLAAMVQAIADTQPTQLVEIGPGRGALTQPLLEAGYPLIALEIDSDLIPHLQSYQKRYPHFQLQQADALKVDLTALSAQPFTLIGNLPYYISSPLIFHALQARSQISDMFFLLQKEVVDRMAAGPGSKTYGRLSIMVQTLCQVQALFDVEPGAFHPVPQVRSCYVHLTPRSVPVAHDPLVLDALVRDAFAQRRKTLANALKAWDPLPILEALEIPAQARAETLSVQTYGALSLAFAQRHPKEIV